MATKYYIRGLGFVEDTPSNRALLVSLGRIQQEPVKVVKTKKKKKDDTADTGYAESDHGNTERTQD
jgi:hypothetical protein